MSPDVQQNSSEPKGRNVELAESSSSWTHADSAAGFVLRYLTAMRGYLVEVLEDEPLADQVITLLLGHLVKRGFGPQGKGRLRDYLQKTLRSAIKATLADLDASERPLINPALLQPDSDDWIAYWRGCMLEVTWRALERYEHHDPESLVYSVLRHATKYPEESMEVLAVRIGSDTDYLANTETVSASLAQGRKLFTELMNKQIGNTLETRTPESIQAEIDSLGLRKVLP